MRPILTKTYRDSEMLEMRKYVTIKTSMGRINSHAVSLSQQLEDIANWLPCRLKKLPKLPSAVG